MSLFNSPDKNIYCLDRNTASEQDKKKLLNELKTEGIKYNNYKERLENAYFIASLELKRFLDRKILSKLKKALKEVSDDRFNELYLDVRFYDAKKENKGEGVWILINFIISIPENDSLDSLTRMKIFNLFKSDKDWNNASHKYKIYKVLPQINTFLQNYSYYSSIDVSEWNLEFDFDTANPSYVKEKNFEKIKKNSYGKSIYKSRCSNKSLKYEIKKIDKKDTANQIIELLCFISQAIGIEKLDPKKVKLSDHVYSLLDYDNFKTDLLIKNFKSALNTSGGSYIFPTVNDLVKEALELIEDYDREELKINHEEIFKEIKRDLYLNSGEFSNNKKKVLKEIKNLNRSFESILQYASENLQDDKEIVLEAVKISCHELKYASERLKADKVIVLKAIKQSGLALEYVDDILKKDKEIVLEAIKQNGFAVKYADDNLKNDPDILAEVNKNKW